MLSNAAGGNIDYRAANRAVGADRDRALIAARTTVRAAPGTVSAPAAGCVRSVWFLARALRAALRTRMSRA